MGLNCELFDNLLLCKTTYLGVMMVQNTNEREITTPFPTIFFFEKMKPDFFKCMSQLFGPNIQ